MSGLAERAAHIRERMAAACQRAGRNVSDVTCIAVSKFHPASAIEQALAAGLRAFGENYAQELAQKQALLPALTPAHWHFVGSLQRNKAKAVAGRVALVHAVDSLPLAETIGRHAASLGATQAILVAVNLGGEASKSGVLAAALPGLLAQLQGVANVRVDGLMTMPPQADAAEANRAYFRQLRALRDANASSALPLASLSMGMSDDFEIAIEEGATHIRIGTAIFGARPSPAK